MEPASPVPPVTPAAQAAPAAERRPDHSYTYGFWGVVALLLGVIAPRIPGYLTSQSGVRYSVASYHAVCTSGLGELVQAGHRAIEGQCSQADLLMTASWVVIAVGVVLVLAGVLVRSRRPAGG